MTKTKKLSDLKTKNGRKVFEVVRDPNDTGEDFDAFSVPLIRFFPHHNLQIGHKRYRNPKTKNEKRRIKKTLVIYLSIIAFVILVRVLTWLGF